MERNSELDRVIRVLIKRQRRLMHSSDLRERFTTLWITTLLDEHLTQCTDHEIGELMVIVQDRFHVFEPEYAICYHAQRRLLLRP